MAKNGNGNRQTAKCPNCGKATVTKFRPFCSKRCAELDLGNWLNEGYSIPVNEEDVDDDDGYSEH